MPDHYAGRPALRSFGSGSVNVCLYLCRNLECRKTEMMCYSEADINGVYIFPLAAAFDGLRSARHGGLTSRTSRERIFWLILQR